MKELTGKSNKKIFKKSLKRQGIQKLEKLVLSGIKMCYITITYRERE